MEDREEEEKNEAGAMNNYVCFWEEEIMRENLKQICALVIKFPLEVTSAHVAHAYNVKMGFVVKMSFHSVFLC